MDFDLSEELQLVYQSVCEFGQKEIRPHSAELERSDDFPRWLWNRLGEQGFVPGSNVLGKVNQGYWA